MEIAYGEIAPQLIEDFSKAQPFGCQPTGKSSLAEAHLLGNRLCLRFTVRQERCDDVLNLRSKRADAGCACRNGVLAVLHHQVVEIRVIANQRQVHHTRVETYLVDMGVESHLAWGTKLFRPSADSQSGQRTDTQRGVPVKSKKNGQV